MPRQPAPPRPALSASGRVGWQVPIPAPARPGRDEIEAERKRIARNAPSSSEGFFHEARHPRAPEDRRSPRRRGDGDAPRLARCGPREPARPPVDRPARARQGDLRRLRRGGHADPDDEHLGREPGQARQVRLGRLPREDQPRFRPPRPRGRRRRVRPRRWRRRASRPARQALRAAHEGDGSRALLRADPDPPRGEGRPPPLRDVLLEARGDRGDQGGPRPLEGDPDPRLDDVPRRRQDDVRDRGRRGAVGARGGRGRRRRHELHDRAAGDARGLPEGRLTGRRPGRRDAERRLPVERLGPDGLPRHARLLPRGRARLREGRRRDRRRLLRHDACPRRRHGEGGRRKEARRPSSASPARSSRPRRPRRPSRSRPRR